MKTTNCEAELAAILKTYGRIAIAYSGGTDSTLLAAAANKALGKDNVLLVHIDSPLLPDSERCFAGEWAKGEGCNLLTILLNPLENEQIRKNDEQRCYYCKKHVMGTVIKEAALRGISCVADGTNVDDFSDYRPGMKASEELGIRHPFVDAKMGKKEIRALAEKYNLPNWNNPAAACLASRIPYHTELDADVLKMIDSAESFLFSLGFRGCRVRYLSGRAKIETSVNDIADVAAMRSDIISGIKSCGFKGVLLDLEGYRQGSLNEDINTAKQ
jgi:uncharacterized protein